MKKLVLSSFIYIFVFLQVYAQEPRPDWVRQPPFPPRGANFILVYGMGIGSTEPEAELAAWKNAIYKALNEGGLVGFNAQEQSLDEVFSMNELETKIPLNALPRRQICQTLPIYVDYNKVKVYVLLQVQRNGGLSNDFYNYGDIITCETDDFKNELKKWNQSENERQKEIREQTDKDLKRQQSSLRKEEMREQKELRRRQSSFFIKNHNSYFLWGMMGTSYPLTWSSSFLGRNGGIIGVGYYMTAGWERSFEEDEYDYDYDGFANDSKDGFHYSTGIKFYPYKTFFLSAGYGTYGYKRIFNSEYDDEDIWEQKKGLQFTVGGDLLSDLDYLGWGISVEVGVSYTKFGIEPLIKIKYCIGGGLHQ